MATPIDLGPLRAKIEGYLREKKLVYEGLPDGRYALRQGSTKVFIVPLAWTGGQTLVKLFAPVALAITQITPELTRFLVEKNAELLFGKFSLDAKGKAIWYEHVLLGNSLDVEELFSAIVTIALTADQYDEQVQALSGGKRLADMAAPADGSPVTSPSAR